MGGRQLGHPEKDCNFKKQSAKNCSPLGRSICESVSGGRAATSSPTNAGIKRVNSGVTGSNNGILLNKNAQVENRYVTRYFYNSAVKPKEVNTGYNMTCFNLIKFYLLLSYLKLLSFIM